MPTLNWIGKEAVANHHQQVPFHLLKDVPGLACGQPGDGNLIIQGDNLVALKALLPYYAGQVKCIYIDPPYNTGNENWIYNDNVNSTVIREWLGKVVGKENEDLCRHDKWLCMMYPRLALLRKFLSEDGVIFISIGREELSNLIILCNEIFDQRNLIEVIVWNTHGHTENQEDITGVHEYVLLYAKDKSLAKIRNIVDPSVPADSKIRRDFAENSITKNGPKNPASTITLPVGFPCEIEALKKSAFNSFSEFRNAVDQLGFIDRELTARYKAKYPILQDPLLVANNKLTKECRVYSGWMSADKLREFIKNGCAPIDDAGTRLSFYLSKNGVIYYRREGRESHYVQSVLTDLGTTETNKYMLEGMGVGFDYPKPIELISYLCSLYTESTDIIMDAFAGSGTTGHAILRLNRDDKSNRRFILVEMDNDIAKAVTAKRISQIATIDHKDAKGDSVKAYGGGFRYCELGEPLFDESGHIRETVSFSDLARHVYFTETGEPLPRERVPKTPFLGEFRGVGVYLLYNGILGDKTVNGGNVLTRSILAKLQPFNGQKVIYCAGCLLGRDRLQTEKIIVRQTPYEIKVS